MKVIVTASLKGGTGKTTTAAAILSGANRRGLKALAIDLDGQGSLTRHIGARRDHAGAYELLTEGYSDELIQHTSFGDVIGGRPKNQSIDASALKNNLKVLRKKYDLIVVDTGPGFNNYLGAALLAADLVIVPTTCTGSGVEGQRDLLALVEDARDAGNKRIEPAVLLTRYNGRRSLEKQMREFIEQECAKIGVKLYGAVIRECVLAVETETNRSCIFDSPKSNLAIDYNKLLDEIGVL